MNNDIIEQSMEDVKNVVIVENHKSDTTNFCIKTNNGISSNNLEEILLTDENPLEENVNACEDTEEDVIKTHSLFQNVNSVISTQTSDDGSQSEEEEEESVSDFSSPSHDINEILCAVLNNDITNVNAFTNEVSNGPSVSSKFCIELLSEKSKDDLLNIIKNIMQENCVLQKSHEGLQKDLDRYDADQSSANYQDHILTLERDLAQAKADAYAWENELKATKEKCLQENISIRTDLTSRLDRAMKQSEAANKDKESMVMKYVMSEKEVLVVKKQKENIEKKLREAERDKEILQGKIKSLASERTRICNTLDNKIQENGIATRTIEKLKEEINGKDIKMKWSQTKLKAELEAHKETEAKLDRALSKICGHEEEIKAVREGAEKLVKGTVDGENARANVLDKQLKENKALLIMEKQKNEDLNALYKQVKSEHEALRSSHFLLDTEVTTLRVKVSKYEHEREESEKLFSSLQLEMKCAKQGAADLSQQLSYSAVYAEQLESERLRAEYAEQMVDDLQTLLTEQSTALSKCKQKEAELLTFTQKLTDKDVTLQSQLTSNEGKTRLLELEHQEMKSQVENLQSERDHLRTELNDLLNVKKAEEERLTSLLKESSEEAANLKINVSDLLNEIQVQRKKHLNSMKDTNREIIKLRKKLDSIENKQTCSKGDTMNVEETIGNGENNSQSNCNSNTNLNFQSPHDSLSQNSRTSSDTSLNAVENSLSTDNTLSSKDVSSPIYDLPQQVLIARIVKLQKNAMKNSEKLEFLEEHVAQLVAELKKKSKIIHHYIMKEETGALSNSKSDDAKAEIMKYGGIMASVYGSSPKDGTMTLDLSLEINRKLQAVLEDTLLKNITLKENLNTLGDEVAKLAMQNSLTSTKS